MNNVSLTITLLVLFIAPAQAAMYKWVDDNGQVQYTDTRPADNREHKRLTAPSSPPPPPEGANTAERAETATGTTGKKENRNCEIARQNLETVRRSASLTALDGQTIPLNEETRALQVETAQKQIDHYCK